MLVLFRLFFTGLFVWLLAQLSRSGQGSVQTDLNSAGWFATAVIVGIAAACTWAPVIGSAVAGSVTGVMTDGTPFSGPDGTHRWIYWALRRGYRRLALLFCVGRGIWDPDQPAAFIIGMEQARAGTWLEKVFAREVWRFSNVQNCLRAHDLLQYRHGEIPPEHSQTSIQLALIARLPTAKPEAPLLAMLPAAPPPKLGRRKRIQLFRGADKSSVAKIP